MKAVRISEFGGPEVLAYVDVARPEPGPKDVLVKAHAIGVGKYDALVRSGKYPYPVTLPAIPGIEMTGTVEAVGRDVDDLAVGEKVYLLAEKRNCYAEYAVASRREITKLGDRMDLDAAVALSNYWHAWAMIYDAADARKVRRAYMSGAAGGIGMAVCQLCKAAGIELIAGASTDVKGEFAKAQGAAHAINTREVTDIPARVLEITDGRGVDLVIDQLVGPDFRDLLKMMAPFGQIVTINALHGLPSSDLFADLRANMVKSVSVRAFSGHVYSSIPRRHAEVLEEVIKLYEAGSWSPAITERHALADVRRAHEILDAGQVLGKMVLLP
jgi:NADPH:quinone reductase